VGDATRLDDVVVTLRRIQPDAAATHEAFEVVLRLDPRDDATYVNLGVLELSSGNRAVGAAYFAEGVVARSDVGRCAAETGGWAAIRVCRSVARPGLSRDAVRRPTDQQSTAGFNLTCQEIIMRTRVTRFLCLTIAIVAVLAVSAADPPGVEHWTSGQLKDFEKTLAAKMGPQKVASQQLANFGNHATLVAHREGDGQGEAHMKQVDVMIIQTGEASIRLGGEIVNGKQTRPNETLGSAVRGGVEKTLRPGDVLHIPAGVPHQMLVQAGKQVTYFVVKIDVP
jgi:hypothetical protein